jgi:hypothetical protein
LASQIRMSALRLDRNERLLRPQRNSSCASRTRYKSAGPLHDSRQFSLCGFDFQSGGYQQKCARTKQPGRPAALLHDAQHIPAGEGSGAHPMHLVERRKQRRIRAFNQRHGEIRIQILPPRDAARQAFSCRLSRPCAGGRVCLRAGNGSRRRTTRQAVRLPRNASASTATARSDIFIPNAIAQVILGSQMASHHIARILETVDGLRPEHDITMFESKPDRDTWKFTHKLSTKRLCSQCLRLTLRGKEPRWCCACTG